MKKLAFLVLFAALSLPPARGGSIDVRYDFHPRTDPTQTIGSFVVDGDSLARGEFGRSDVISFQFNVFGRPQLLAIGGPIDADGTPLADTTFTARSSFSGQTLALALPWGPRSFGPSHTGDWEIDGGGHAILTGSGWWSVALVPSAVPEPSSLALAAAALACVAASRRYVIHPSRARRSG